MIPLNVPHYCQRDQSACQAACAAMLLDYWNNRTDGGTEERLSNLLDEFSFEFRPESGKIPPAITGLVAMAIAKFGFTVDFYSTNPDGGGIEGLRFLKDPPWEFTENDVEKYAEHARRVLARAPQAGVVINEHEIGESDVEGFIALKKPIVMIVDLQVLKGWSNSANHAVVVTGIDADVVAIQDPDDPEPHKQYARNKFFAAHFRAETDCDAYIAAPRDAE